MFIRQSRVRLSAKGRDVQAYLAEPDSGGPGILLLHAWWGLKPEFMKFCDRLAERGFVAIAPDLREGQIARTIDEAQALMDKSDHDFETDIVLSAKDHLWNFPGRKGPKIGVVGFSMGGAWSLRLASSAPDQVSAAVLFYGSGDVDSARVKSRILGHFSKVDEWEPSADIVQLESRLRAAGVDVVFHTYPGVKHWFVEEDRPEYDPGAARLAWQRTFEFLKSSL